MFRSDLSNPANLPSSALIELYKQRKTFKPENRDELTALLKTRLPSLSRAELDELSQTLHAEPEEKQSHNYSLLHTLHSIITSPISGGTFTQQVDSALERKAEEDFNRMQKHFAWENWLITGDTNAPVPDLKDVQLNDTVLTTLFRQHSHAPLRLRNLLTNLFKAASPQNFHQTEMPVIKALFNQFHRAGKHDAKAYLPYLQMPSLCCFLNCLFTVAEQEGNAQQRQRNYLRSQIKSLKDKLVDATQRGYPETSIYLSKQLSNDVSPEFKNSFFLNLLDNTIYQRWQFRVGSDEKISTNVKMADFEEHMRIAGECLNEHYASARALFDTAVMTIEKEYQRLLRDPGNCVKTRGGQKAEALLETLQTIATHTSNFVFSDNPDINELRRGMNAAVTSCLNNPVFREKRCKTADLLRGLLGVILFVPTLGATYWSNTLYNTFFGAPRSVMQLKKTKATTLARIPQP